MNYAERFFMIALAALTIQDQRLGRNRASEICAPLADSQFSTFLEDAFKFGFVQQKVNDLLAWAAGTAKEPSWYAQAKALIAARYPTPPKNED